MKPAHKKSQGQEQAQLGIFNSTILIFSKNLSVLKSLGKVFVFLLGLTLPYLANANDFFSSIEVDNEDSELAPPSNWQFRGNYLQHLHYGLQSPPALFERNQQGLNQVRSEWLLELDAKLSEAHGLKVSAKSESDFLFWQNNQQHWQGDEHRFYLRDAYIDSTWQNGIWMRLGHQVIAWGESEGLRITDVLSPYDQRQPGQAQLRDIREHIPALLLSIPVSEQVKLVPVITYRANANRYDAPGGEFDPMVSLRQANISAQKRQVEHPWEMALRLESQLNGSDIHFTFAQVNARDISPNIDDSLYFERRRQTILGANANRALGNWLLKTEVAHWKNVAYNENLLAPAQRSNQWRTMLGAEYSGWRNWIIAIEANNVQNQTKGELSTKKQHSSGGLIRLNYQSDNARLDHQWWFIKLAEEDAKIVRWQSSYEINDAWDCSLGFTLYHTDNKEKAFYSYRNNDSLIASLSYSF